MGTRPTSLRKNGPKKRAISQTPIAKACSPLPFNLRLASEGVCIWGAGFSAHFSSSQVIVKSRQDNRRCNGHAVQMPRIALSC